MTNDDETSSNHIDAEAEGDISWLRTMLSTIMIVIKTNHHREKNLNTARCK